MAMRVPLRAVYPMIGLVAAVGLTGCPQDIGGYAGPCTRTVQTIPENTYVQLTFDIQFDILYGEDIGLGKALTPYLLQVWSGSDYDFRMVCQVGASGEVSSMYSLFERDGENLYWEMPVEPGDSAAQFVVRDGCLSFELGAIDELSWLAEPDEYDDPICGAQAISLWQGGTLGGTTGQGDQVCLQIDVADSCVTCWQDSSGWYQEVSYRITCVALGTLPDVTVLPVSGGAEQENVTVSEGDQVTMEMSMTVDCAVSPSPQDMGFEKAEPMVLTGVNFPLTN